ncbi:MAG: hypothetical protein ACI4GD_12100 [Lachnospiraceae bacterium]
MRSFYKKTVKYLMLLIIIAVAVRIAYVNLTQKETETIVSIGDVITYNNLNIKLTEAKAAFVDDMYRIEFELEIENNTDETQEFAYYLLAVYSDAISNGVIPCNADEYLGKVNPNKRIEPGETVTSWYCTEIYRQTVNDKSWDNIDKKNFKLLLLEYKNNTGWQINPEEYDIDKLSASNEGSADNDIYKRIRLDEDEFYKTQFVSVGESVTCLWRLISGSRMTYIDITVEEVIVSKEVTDDWKYILDDIQDSSISYSPYISEMEVEENTIINSYSAVKAKVRVNAEEETSFAVSDLNLYQLDSEFYPVVTENSRLNNFYSAFFTSDGDNEFLGYQLYSGYYISDECEREILLKKGVNEFTMVYIVPDFVLNSPDEMYLESNFIGVASNSVKEKHCYQNTSALIKCPLK